MSRRWTLGALSCLTALASVGCNGLGASGDRAPSPSAVTEPAPRALGAHAASQLPLDGGTVGSLPAPEEPQDPLQAPDATPSVPAPAVPDAGVAL